MATRTYGQFCGLAQALDVLGERWSLLVLRELALGPKRYGDLLRALPGIGTNLLAARLRSLEAADVVRRTTLPPPAGVAVYELTESAIELWPVMEDLALWGMRMLPPEPEGDDVTRAGWAALSMAGAARSRTWPGPQTVIEVHAGDERVWFRLGPEVEVGEGPPPRDPDLRLVCDVRSFLSMASGQATPAELIEDGAMELRGSRRTLERALRLLRLPPLAQVPV